MRFPADAPGRHHAQAQDMAPDTNPCEDLHQRPHQGLTPDAAGSARVRHDLKPEKMPMDESHVRNR